MPPTLPVANKPVKHLLLFAALLFPVACHAQTTPRVLTVASDGTGQFQTVQAAVDAVPAGRKAGERVVIRIKPGTYKGPVVVGPLQKEITFAGETGKAAQTIVTNDWAATKTDPKTGKPYGTSGSASVVLAGEGFQADNITFENAAGKGHDVGQAVAVKLTADKAVFRNCRFLGWQDTLYANGANCRQYFDHCTIEGSVDFIFGSARAVFDYCKIVSREGGFITAQSRLTDDESGGYVFRNCDLSALPGVPDASVYLGRPWRLYARVVFLNCRMGAHIKPEGWRNWEHPDAAGKPQNGETTAFYGEFGSTGPGRPSSAGAAQNKRVAWAKTLTAADVEPFDTRRFLAGTDGWNPLDGQNAAAATIKIVLAGDSTVIDTAGWGVGFAQRLTDGAECVNRSRGGRSTRTFAAEGLWKTVLADKGDYVLIQFGHNDSAKDRPDRYTPLPDYVAYLRQFVDEARANGAQPVLVTSLTRRNWNADGTKIRPDLDEYVAAAKQVAKEKKVPLLDLHTLSVAACEAVGKKGVVAWSPPKGDTLDNTHLTPAGSLIMGKIVADELKKILPDLAPCIK